MSKTTDASSLSRRALLATAAAGVTVLAVSLFATLVAAQDLNTGVGTLDGNSAEKVFTCQAAVLAIRRAQISDPPVLRRHAPAHCRVI